MLFRSIDRHRRCAKKTVNDCLNEVGLSILHNRGKQAKQIVVLVVLVVSIESTPYFKMFFHIMCIDRLCIDRLMV